MKKTFTLIIASFSAVLAFSQTAKQPVDNYTAAPTNAIFSHYGEKADTVLYPTSYYTQTCGNLLIYTFSIQGNFAGYIYGFNAYLDQAKGMIFNAYGDVTEIIAPIAAKFPTDSVIPASGNYHAKIYSINFSDSTGTLLGTSDPIAYANLDTNKVNGVPNSNVFTFSSPVIVSGHFLAVIEVFDLVDTLSGIILFANGDACGTGDAWEVWADGSTLAPIQTGYSFNGNPLLADVLMGVHVTNAFVPTGLENNETTTSVYPNPATDVVTFNYHLAAASDVIITLTNIQGQVVGVYNQGSRGTGANISTLDVSGFAPGTYFYTVNAASGVSKGKIMVK